MESKGLLVVACPQPGSADTQKKGMTIRTPEFQTAPGRRNPYARVAPSGVDQKPRWGLTAGLGKRGSRSPSVIAAPGAQDTFSIASSAEIPYRYLAAFPMDTSQKLAANHQGLQGIPNAR